MPALPALHCGWRALAARAAALAGALLLAGCATPPAPGLAVPAADAWRAAPRTGLAGAAAAPFVVAQQRDGDAVVTLLARRPAAGQAPEPVARLVQRGDGAAARIAITLPAAPDATLVAQLYALVLRQEALARLCLGRAGRPCDADADGLSQAGALQALAAVRARALAGQPAAVPWQHLALAGVPVSAWDPDTVAARATGPQGPVEGITLYFNRAPHSLCEARTGADGIATCRLVDQHGDEQTHDHAAAVVATYPGDLRPERVLLPTAAVVRAAPASTLAFAQPIPWGALTGR